MKERELKEEEKQAKDAKGEAKKDAEEEEDDGDCGLSAAKIREMKELARKLARQFMEDRSSEKQKEAAPVGEANQNLGQEGSPETEKQKDAAKTKGPSGGETHPAKEESSEAEPGAVDDSKDEAANEEKLRKREKHKRKKEKRKEKKEKHKRKKRRKATDASEYFPLISKFIFVCSASPSAFSFVVESSVRSP